MNLAIALGKPSALDAIALTLTTLLSVVDHYHFGSDALRWVKNRWKRPALLLSVVVLDGYVDASILGRLAPTASNPDPDGEGPIFWWCLYLTASLCRLAQLQVFIRIPSQPTTQEYRLTRFLAYYRSEILCLLVAVLLVDSRLGRKFVHLETDLTTATGVLFCVSGMAIGIVKGPRASWYACVMIAADGLRRLQDAVGKQAQ